MTEGQISIGMGLLAFIMQMLNMRVVLTIKNSILESEKSQSKEVDAKLKLYVLDEVCRLRHESEAVRRAPAA